MNARRVRIWHEVEILRGYQFVFWIKKERINEEPRRVCGKVEAKVDISLLWIKRNELVEAEAEAGATYVCVL